MPLAPGWSWISKVDAGCHRCLEPEDSCAYLRTREPRRRGESYSKTNSVIANFKKPPAMLSSRPELRRFKEYAVRSITSDVIRLFEASRSGERRYLIVPAVTSVPSSCDEFDDRIYRVCRGVADAVEFVETCSLLDVDEKLVKSHHGGTRSVEEIRSHIVIGEHPALDPMEFSCVYIFDDVIATGAHFKACQAAILEAFGVRARGIFWARAESPAEIEERRHREYDAMLRDIFSNNY